MTKKVPTLVFDNPIEAKCAVWMLLRTASQFARYWGQESAPIIGNSYLQNIYNKVKPKIWEIVQTQGIPILNERKNKLHRTFEIENVLDEVCKQLVCNAKLVRLINSHKPISIREGLWFIWDLGGLEVVAQKALFVKSDPDGFGSASSLRYHCEDGPAVAWKDLELYFWHGVPIPKNFLTGNWSAQRILKVKNTEHRRILFEIYAKGDRSKFLKELDPELVDQDTNLGQARKLYKFLMPAVNRWQIEITVGMLELTNGTQEADGSYKKYYIFVPPDMKTCQEAVAWINYLPLHHKEKART